MLSWSQFSKSSDELAIAGKRLLDANEVAFLGTTSAEGRPRIHPFVPKIVDGMLVAFIRDTSPKRRDLDEREYHAIHFWPGEEDEEFCIFGKVISRNEDEALREKAADAMGFFTGVDEHHILYEFLIDQALWTIWLDFGTADHRPQRKQWRAGR